MSQCANPLRECLHKYFSAEQLKRLAQAKVGIAGAGGLGSNAAMLLARCGVEKLLLVDYDVVEASNLNRQHYLPEHLGKNKVEALAESLERLNPHIKPELLNIRLDKQNLPAILQRCPYWVEALDTALAKSMFVKEALRAGRMTVSASGLCGFGGAPMQKKRMDNLLVVGDYKTGLDCAPPLAPRVMQAAALLADGILEMILEGA